MCICLFIRTTWRNESHHNDMNACIDPYRCVIFCSMSSARICAVYRVVSCSLHAFCWLFYTCISQMVLLTSDIASVQPELLGLRKHLPTIVSLSVWKTETFIGPYQFLPSRSACPTDFAMTGYNEPIFTPNSKSHDLWVTAVFPPRPLFMLLIPY